MGRLASCFDPLLDSRHPPHYWFDGLQGECEKQITFRVGHRFINWQGDRWHLIDDPGHAHLISVTLSGLCQSDMVIYVLSLNEFQEDLFDTHLSILEWLGNISCVFVINKFEDNKKQRAFFERIRQKLDSHKLWRTADLIPVNALMNLNFKDPFYPGQSSLTQSLQKLLHVRNSEKEFLNLDAKESFFFDALTWGECSGPLRLISDKKIFQCKLSHPSSSLGMKLTKKTLIIEKPIKEEMILRRLFGRSEDGLTVRNIIGVICSAEKGVIGVARGSKTEGPSF